MKTNVDFDGLEGVSYLGLVLVKEALVQTL